MQSALTVFLLLALHAAIVLCAPSIKAAPDKIINLANITISWSDIPTPSAEDLIIIRSTEKDHYTNVATYRVNETTSDWKSGSGTFKLFLLNMRSDYIIEYQGARNKFLSNIIRVNPNYPMQGHLSLTGDLSEMRVMWVSGSKSRPIVQYGTSPNALNLTMTGITTSYERDQMCWDTEGGYIAYDYFWKPGFIHNAVMTNLNPHTRYYYRFGSEDSWSETFEFISPQTDRDSRISVIAFGDSGVAQCQNIKGWCQPASGPTAQRILEAMSTHDYDLLFHIGDISYAVGYALRWEQFFHQIQPIATRVPYLVSIGNHEYDYIGQPFRPPWSDYNDDSHGECGVPFNHRFQMPSSPNSNGNLWWSIEYGPVHFAFISTEHNWTIGSEQYKWLEQDFASVDRKRTPWLVLSGHRPMYSGMIESSTVRVARYMRDNLEDLMMKYSVDVALWGHVHNYERTCPAYQEKCRGDLENPGAPVHFVIGMAGMSISTEWADPQPEWSMFRAANYGHSRIHATPTLFNLQYWTNQDGRIHDNVFLHKKAGFDFKGFQ